MVFVIRIRGQSNLSYQQNSLLFSLGLKKVHQGHFFRLDPAMKKTLLMLENHIVYGFVDKKMVEQLVRKRGFFRINGKFEPIESNRVVEENLAEKDLICVQDLVKVLSYPSDKLEAVKKYLKMFQLGKPSFGYGKKWKRRREGGAWGHCENFDELLQKMI